MTLATNILALICYALALWSLTRGVVQHLPVNRKAIINLSIVGGLSHLIAASTAIFSGSSADFSLFLSGSLIFSVTVILVAFSSLKRPVHTILLIIQPVAVFLIVANLITTPTKTATVSFGAASHILFSVLSYGVITIAACCALLMYYSNYLLKHKQIGRTLAQLPPMETIDKLLFEMIVVGELLLTASIISGFLFIDDFLAQKLAHKTFFSLLSWIIFALLIAGHYRFGWRGAKTIKWTLSGFAALLLAYVGSKFVIEWVLG